MKKILGIFLLALVLRLAMVGIWYGTGQGERISSDAQAYSGMAQSLLEGKGFPLQNDPNFRRLPVYPLLIAFCLLWAPYPLGVQIAQAVVGALSCVVLFGIGKEMFNEKVGILASLGMGFEYLSIRQTVSILAETVFLLLLLVTFYFLLRTVRSESKRWFAGAGVFAGLTLLTKDQLFLFFPLVALWLLAKGPSWKRGFFRAAVFSISLLLVTVPWIVRNRSLGQESVAATRGIGHVLYFANNPEATGGTTGGDWELGRDSWLPWYDNDLPPGATLAEWDRYLFRRAVKFIRDEPASFLKLTGRKIVNMWRPYQTDSNGLAKWAQGVTYVPVVTLGLAGLFLSRDRWREFFPIYLLIGYVFFFHAFLIAHIRYRFPVMPFFMVFAAFALLSILSKRTVAHAHPVNQ